MQSLTPMMRQYMEIKDKNKDSILFFRLGDFYEMFFDDAICASKELEITLTGRDCGLKERAPMCGVPFHSADTYISKLVNKGYKVAICEQVEDPSDAKGIVRREIIRVVTPGTVDSSMLEEKKNNYLMSLYITQNGIGIAATDISTGDLFATRINSGNITSKLIDEIAKYSPTEIVINNNKYDNYILAIKKRFDVFLSTFDPCLQSLSQNQDKEAATENDLALFASNMLLAYIEYTQKADLKHIGDVKLYDISEFMILDASTRKNLELVETMKDKSKKGSLIWVLDKTMTSMGGRLLRKWVLEPLINTEEIKQRLDSVQEIKEKFMIRMELRESLKKVYDIERLSGKIALGTVNCRDLIALKNSISQIPYIKNFLSELESQETKEICEKLDNLDDIYELIEKAIIDDPPVTVKEGGIIKKGFNKDIDKYKKASTEGKSWIAALEHDEREKTGIKNLKVGFNKVFGYYLEVTKSYYSCVPPNYIRKQTLANCERFITSELKEIEDTILGAEEKLIELEYQVFLQVKDIIAENIHRLKNSALSLAKIDCIASLAEIADRENYVRPEILSDDKIDIKDGRHPVVEKMLEQNLFVPNDTLLDSKNNMVSIITGPNMAGKSTYMRQTALIVLMAQIGSFVPAKSAQIGIVDRIFTRVGASDDLAMGQSTFMVEMAEVANILNNATNKSLLILDEIGRGTSTFDGLSIAWSVIEHISDKRKLGARTLFATHYHELTELEGKIPGIKNYCISVQEKGDDIVFLRKIIRGGADESYGIQVAKLAGLPNIVIERAKEILKELENADLTKYERKVRKSKMPIDGQVDMFGLSFDSKEKEVLEQIKNIDVMGLTPMDALNVLDGIRRKLV